MINPNVCLSLRSGKNIPRLNFNYRVWNSNGRLIALFWMFFETIRSSTHSTKKPFAVRFDIAPLTTARANIASSATSAVSICAGFSTIKPQGRTSLKSERKTCSPSIWSTCCKLCSHAHKPSCFWRRVQRRKYVFFHPPKQVLIVWSNRLGWEESK